jgi:hypothetical protein
MIVTGLGNCFGSGAEIIFFIKKNLMFKYRNRVLKKILKISSGKRHNNTN